MFLTPDKLNNVQWCLERSYDVEESIKERKKRDDNFQTQGGVESSKKMDLDEYEKNDGWKIEISCTRRKKLIG